ncbi:hypothetical protein E8E13_001589 [Curvularia kusanoi]|uniref:Uncharacterized protein n=1 Tax=Curvularia kusanoi TaxID=90978 RepID=A0A9P4WDN8_CURKU|nr:hypothetical protein E8E13_001589 [Curvularia kusanoi]
MTPEDPHDDDYEPTPKRNKRRKGSSGRVTAEASHIPNGIPIHSRSPSPMTPTPKAQGPTSNKRATSVIELPETPPGVAALPESPLTELDMSGSSTVREDSPRAAVVPQNRLRTDEETSPESLRHKIDVCLTILSGLVNHQSDIPEETSEHYHQLIRTLKDPNGSIVDNLIKDLDSQRALKAKYAEMVKKLIGSIDSGTRLAFPKETPPQEVEKAWATIYDHFVFVVGPNNVTPIIGAASAGYVVGAAENIATGLVPDHQLDSYIESLSALLRSPHAQQTLFSALFCRWVFSMPEPMLHAMHSGGMMHLYDSMIASAASVREGLIQILRYDKAASKLMFENSDFEKTKVTPRIEDLMSRLQIVKEKRCRKSDIPSSRSPKGFARDVIEFKKLLLMSSKRYRIRYVRPGTLFDQRWMQAYSDTNDSVSSEEANGRKIILCMFPALLCEKGEAINDGMKIEDVLVKNRRFFPTFEEDLQLDSVTHVSKAAVLVRMS